MSVRQCTFVFSLVAALAVLSVQNVPATGAGEGAPGRDPAAVSSGGNLVFIIDASGSMWGQVEGTAKIAIAKEVLANLIRGLPDDSEVGLVAYGHRRKGDCDDVEELISLGPLEKEKAVAEIQALTPRGMTPISRSVRLTAERLRNVEDETTIILVSDGKETCDPDPCGLVRDLKASGVNFVMHVVGFDVNDEERAQLECMARAGGGEYHTAANAGEFLAAAREVVEAPAFNGGILEITTTKEGKPFPAAAHVYRQDDKENMGSKSTWTHEKPARFKLIPGTYAAGVTDRTVTPYQTREIRDIEIVAGQTVKKTLTFGGAGTLRISTVKDGQPFSASVSVYRQDDGKAMPSKGTWAHKKPAEYELVPGVYSFKVIDRTVTPYQTQEIRDIEVLAGQTVEKTVTFGGSGTLRITTVKDGQPFNASVSVYRQSDRKALPGKGTWSRNKPAEYKVAPGVYFLKVTDRSAVPYVEKEIRDIQVQAGQTVEKSIPFEKSGVLRVTTVKDGQPFNASVSVHRQSDRKALPGKGTWSHNKPAEYTVVPGVYSIKVTDRSETPYKSQESSGVEILPGQAVEKTFNF